ncbi:hypothetical protein F4802DRAFT_161281 [Xylaria palmicola]|nr:hypothetical protein F4802DRAFT_161281 [Xylaria palmicola]
MMARPRKRKRPASADAVPAQDYPVKKKTKKKHHDNKEQDDSQSWVNSQTRHPVLSQYYPQVQSLRDYVLNKLPSSSRIRRRKVSAVGIANGSSNMPLNQVEQSLGALLDTTLVGLSKSTTGEESNRMDGWRNFSQRGDESNVTLSNGVAGFVESQAMNMLYGLYSTERKLPNGLTIYSATAFAEKEA